MPESLDILLSFDLNRFQQRVVRRILEPDVSYESLRDDEASHLSAAEHEVLPYKDAEL